jgi:tripartite-type tricarboxylate transporter receptor subunit TctC
MHRRRQLLVRGTSAALLAAATASLVRPAAAAFPDHPITIVVPFAPGGANDLVGRVLADRMGPLLAPGGRAVVENRPGAGSALGADYVRRAKPDGYTLLVGSSSTLAVNPATQVSSVRYHPTEDFTPIALLGTSALALVVPAQSDIRTAEELVKRVREKPGSLGFASAGVGAVGHLAGEWFATMAAGKAMHVPYRGGSSLAEALIKREVDFALDQVGSVVGQIRDGSLRLLAVTTRTRDRAFPDVPTLTEAALPGYELTTWSALVGPKGLPPEVAQSLNRAANAALAEPVARTRFETAGIDPVTDSTPASTREFLDRELARFREIVASTGLQMSQ